MRTLVLVVVGGALLYFAWSTFREVDAAPETPESPGTGQLMTVAGMETALEEGDVEGGAVPEATTPGAGVSAPDPEPPREGPATADEPPIEVPEQLSSRASGEADNAPEGDAEDLPLAAYGDPLHEGEMLLHSPADLQDYLKGAGANLSKNRKKLLIAYALLIRGLPDQVAKYTDGLKSAAEVTTEEYELLASALRGAEVRARSASHKLQRNPLVLGVSMALMARQGEEFIRAQQCSDAAGVFSELLLAEIDAPWRSTYPATLGEWSERLHEAQACHRWRKDGEWDAIETEVMKGDSLIAIRRRVLRDHPDMLICTGLVERANQVARYLREGQVLRVPTATPRVLVDLSARWLFYLHGAEVVGAWEVSIGTPGSATTPGHYSVGEKIPEPPWFPRGRAMVPYGDPDNPLGTRWITLTDSNSLGIHGTWEPEKLGQEASDGCIRLRNDAVEELFEILPRGAEVVVRP